MVKKSEKKNSNMLATSHNKDEVDINGVDPGICDQCGDMLHPDNDPGICDKRECTEKQKIDDMAKKQPAPGFREFDLRCCGTCQHVDAGSMEVIFGCIKYRTPSNPSANTICNQWEREPTMTKQDTTWQSEPNIKLEYCDVSYLHVTAMCRDCGAETTCDHGNIKMGQDIGVLDLCYKCAATIPSQQEARFRVMVWLEKI